MMLLKSFTLNTNGWSKNFFTDADHASNMSLILYQTRVTKIRTILEFSKKPCVLDFNLYNFYCL